MVLHLPASVALLWVQTQPKGKRETVRTMKKRYSKHNLTKLGLLRTLTRFSF
jgi:hypothetical protein